MLAMIQSEHISLFKKQWWLENIQFFRKLTRFFFFILFLLAPALDIFRFDLPSTHFVFFGHYLSFDLGQAWVSSASSTDVGGRILFRFLLPLVLIIGVGLFIFYQWGRLYCGWLCPHFSVVEMINGLMEKKLGRVTLWESVKPGFTSPKGIKKHANTLILILIPLLIAFTWAMALLTYLMPPKQVVMGLFTGNLYLAESIFISVATLLFTLDFLLARHLFCKYGCAVGYFQSLMWMINSKANVVEFDRDQARICQECDKVCEDACPMRLPVRGFKRGKFSCTQCMQCVSACVKVQNSLDHDASTLLLWQQGEKRKQTSLIPVRQIDPKKTSL